MKSRKNILKTAITVIAATLIIAGAIFTAVSESSKQESSKDTLACSLTIKCETALSNSAFSPNKAEIIPSDGIIFEADEITFKHGDSVYDILADTAKQNNLHFESASSSYGVYIKGIGNLYSGDCGELSGWLYKVNGEAASVSCSGYFPNNGDSIEWLYSCDGGPDIGITY